MRFLPLLWSNLVRRKVRTICSGLSIFVAFLLMGALLSIRAGFSRGVTHGHRPARGEPQELVQPADAACIPGPARGHTRRRRCQLRGMVPRLLPGSQKRLPEIGGGRGHLVRDVSRSWAVPTISSLAGRPTAPGRSSGRTLPSGLVGPSAPACRSRARCGRSAAAAPGSSQSMASTRPGRRAGGTRHST